MAKATSNAYDLSMFEATEPRLRAVKSPEKTEAMQKRKARRERRFRYITTGIIVVLMAVTLIMMIISRVQLTELNDQITAGQEELAILQSETSRLSNELSAKTSAQSVDAYAKENGMEKVESYQIEYITVDGGDKIEVSDPAPDGIFETIGAAIAGWFGA